MTRFYPVNIDKEHQSEVKFFNQLKHSEKENDWLILHSMGLSKPTGEIDFVILIPGEGIVCVEVKGGRVYCENGEWYGIDGKDRVHKKPKSPFLQARKNMFNLKESCANHFGKPHILSKMTWHYMVCFTDIDSPPLTPEFKQSQVIDINQLMSTLTKSILSSIREERSSLGKVAQKYSPSLNDMYTMLKFIRPNFHRVPMKSASIAFTEKQIESLTEEQYDGLDLLEFNDRCLIEGSAGTGKTVLAIEYARRMITEGKKVLFLCYNNLLGSWLRDQFNDNSNLTVGNFHKIFRDLVLSSSTQERYLYEEKNVDNFYTHQFCAFAMDAIVEHDLQYDLVIVDEMQDLSVKYYLDVLDLILNNGLKNGNWAFFGDFNRQSLYNQSDIDPKKELKDYMQNSGFTYQRLKINCRNSQEIAKATAYLSGLNSVDTKTKVRSDIPVEYVTWETYEEEQNKLMEIIDTIKKNNVLPNQIMILSSRNFENSSIKQVAEKLKINEINKYNFDKPQPYIGFSTIYSFKGMESPVVILIDLEKNDQEKYDSLLYTGMSRAKSLLYVLMSAQTYNTLQPRILKTYME